VAVFFKFFPFFHPKNRSIKAHTVKERSWKVLKFEIYIPDVEKSWKFEKNFFRSWKRSLNFRFFPKLLFADGLKVKKFGNFVSSFKTFSQWGISLILFTSPVVNFEVLELD